MFMLQGDSGSPMWCPSKTGTPKAYGIASGAEEFCGKNELESAKFTKVAKYVGWIKSEIERKSRVFKKYKR